MSTLAETGASVTTLEPALLAGLLLEAQRQQRSLGLPCSTPSAILEATGAGRSWAYAQRERVREQLRVLQRPVGRPRCHDELGAAAEHEAVVSATLGRAMLRHVMAHPGCVTGRGRRTHYSEGLRRKVLDLRREYAGLPLEAFASAVAVPLGTLETWLSLPSASEPESANAQPSGDTLPESEAAPSAALDAHAEGNTIAGDPADVHREGSITHGHQAVDESAAELESFTAPSTPEALRIETILHAWEDWDGPFTAFVEHLQRHLAIAYGRDTVARILREVGTLSSRPRPGRSADELALRGSFETHYPGAQWVGDGKSVTVSIQGQTITPNMQLMVDAASAAWVGLCVSKTEDSDAVVCSYGAAFATIEEGPLAVLLDGHPCNHTEQVADALAVDGGVVIAATPYRAQNKAHCEGAFGLFSQELPPIVLTNPSEPETLALEVLRLVATAYARGLNGRPMRKHGGKTRAELYQAKPTPEQIERAKADLAERHRKQEKARETELARQDPLKRARLDAAFERLGLDDPKGNIRLAIARYPLSAILDGIAIYEGMLLGKTLPRDVDARYLLGIVRNRATLAEGLAITEALIRERTLAHDLLLGGVERRRHLIETQTSDIDTRVLLFVDEAVDAPRQIEQSFWILAAVDEASSLDLPARSELLRDAARRIYSSFNLAPRERQSLALRLIDGAIPVA